MATAVGKQFPDLNVDAMNEMGDTFKVNVLEEAKTTRKKYFYSGTQKILLLYVQQNYMLFKLHLGEFEKRNTMLLVHLVILPEVHFAWLSTAKDNGGIEGVTYHY